jgi:hypothetical protein
VNRMDDAEFLALSDDAIMPSVGHPSNGARRFTRGTTFEGLTARTGSTNRRFRQSRTSSTPSTSRTPSLPASRQTASSVIKSIAVANKNDGRRLKRGAALLDDPYKLIRRKRRQSCCRPSHCMAVPMVQVWIVGMSVDHRRMLVHVDKRFSRRVIRFVPMPMVFVMHMGMLVNHLVVRMLVFVLLDEVHVNADPHQDGSRGQAGRNGLAEQHQGKDRTNEGCRGEAGAGPGRPEGPERQDEQDEAGAIAEEADQRTAA